MSREQKQSKVSIKETSMCSLHKAFPDMKLFQLLVTIHFPLPQIQVTINIKSEPVTLKTSLPVLPVFQYHMQLQGG